MYGLAAEYYLGTDGATDPAVRWATHPCMARQPGFRRRLSLQADGGRRVVDFFLFASPEAARAALASNACHTAAPALLVSESPHGDLVVLLRSTAHSSRGGQSCWRDHLAVANPELILW
jgi:hypothetical protein